MTDQLVHTVQQDGSPHGDSTTANDPRVNDHQAHRQEVHATSPIDIETAELHGLLGRHGETVVVDVRTPAEFESAHIPGAVNVPLDDLRQHAAEVVGHFHGPVVLTCQRGPRSHEAAIALARAGADDLRVLVGGMHAWESNGGLVDLGKQRWAIDRQVRFLAGSLVAGSVLASSVIAPAKWLAAAVGIGLSYSAYKNSCSMAWGLRKLQERNGPSFSLPVALERLDQAARRQANPAA